MTLYKFHPKFFLEISHSSFRENGRHSVNTRIWKKPFSFPSLRLTIRFLPNHVGSTEIENIPVSLWKDILETDEIEFAEEREESICRGSLLGLLKSILPLRAKNLKIIHPSSRFQLFQDRARIILCHWKSKQDILPRSATTTSPSYRWNYIWKLSCVVIKDGRGSLCEKFARR